MPEWKFVIDDRVFEIFNSKPKAQRMLLWKAFETLRAEPMREGRWMSHDEFGRDVDVAIFGPFMVHFWSDIAAKEVRIVNVIPVPRG